MSFLGKLMQIGGVVAAPFSGGASLALTAAGRGVDAIRDASNVAGKAAQGAAAGRQTEAENILRQDALRNSQYGTQQGAEMQAGNLDLNRKGFEEDARGGRAKQALLASLLGGGFQPTSIDVPGIKKSTITGGLAASLQNPGAQQAMQELMRQALAAQMQQGSPEGEQFSGGKVLAPPSMTALPKAGGMENVLGGVGLGGSMLSSILGNLQNSGTQSASGGGSSSSGGPTNLGAMPGGAVAPRTGQLQLPTSNIADILARLQHQSNQGGG